MKTINYKDTNEVLHINKYHLLLVLERLEKQKLKFPLLEHVMIPFGVLIPTLVAFLTADFKNSLGLGAHVWQMFILTIMVLSTLVTAVFLGLWVRNRIRHKPTTPDKIVEEIIKEMERRKRS